LGGDDFDKVLINWVADEFQKENGIDLRNDQMALQRLKEACEKAKCELSTGTETGINLPFITADQNGPKHLMTTLSRAKFEALGDPLFERIKDPCRMAFKDSKLKPSDVDEVILVGGSTRIPKVQEIVKGLFQREPNRSINPDEVVAMGAAIQGGVLTGEVESLVLLDVTPLSLGIETLGNVMTVLVPRNTTIPASKRETFTTASDGQTTVDVHVLQGERPMAPDNRTLGRFHLEGLPPAPRGVPQIEVEFDIDANGILNVSAKDKASGKEQKVRIEQSSGLTEEDIKKMQEEAERCREQDKAARERADRRNEADNVAYQARKLIKEHEDKLEDADKEELEARAKEIDDALAKDDLDSAVQTAEQLKSLLTKAREKVYRATAGQAAGQAETASSPASEESGDQVVDADYEVKE
ncbi:MAG: Hsp70 family protein, partial [Planctomycetota bacterium]